MLGVGGGGGGGWGGWGGGGGGGGGGGEGLCTVENSNKGEQYYDGAIVIVS